MFYYLNGKLVVLEAALAVIDCVGVGYQMTVSLVTSSLLSQKVGENVKLYTHLAVREDGAELFGFSSSEERKAFLQLISVSGIGPKAAMGILSIMTPDDLALAVCTEDVKSISRAPNVGAKTAARIVLELRDKVSKDMLTGTAGRSSAKGMPTAAMPSGKLAEATEALLVLGYDKNSVLDALKGADPTSDVGELIKGALKRLSR